MTKLRTFGSNGATVEQKKEDVLRGLSQLKMDLQAFRVYAEGDQQRFSSAVQVANSWAEEIDSAVAHVRDVPGFFGGSETELTNVRAADESVKPYADACYPIEFHLGDYFICVFRNGNLGRFEELTLEMTETAACLFHTLDALSRMYQRNGASQQFARGVACEFPDHWQVCQPGG